MALTNFSNSPTAPVNGKFSNANNSNNNINHELITATTVTQPEISIAKYGHEREIQVQRAQQIQLCESVRAQRQNDNGPNQQRGHPQQLNDGIWVEDQTINIIPVAAEKYNVDIIRNLALFEGNIKNAQQPQQIPITTTTTTIIAPSTPANMSGHNFDQHHHQQANALSNTLNNNKNNNNTNANATAAISDNDLSHQSHPAVRSDVRLTSSQAVVVFGGVGSLAPETCPLPASALLPILELELELAPSPVQHVSNETDNCTLDCQFDGLIAAVDGGVDCVERLNDWQEAEISVYVPSVDIEMTVAKVADCAEEEEAAEQQLQQLKASSPSVLSDNQAIISDSYDELNEIMKYEMKSVKGGLPLSTVRAHLKHEPSLSSVVRSPSGTTFGSSALSVDLPKRFSSVSGRVSHLSPAVNEVSRSVSVDNASSALPARTRLRRQTRMLSMDADDKPEDPIERLNRLRARISGALTEVKGVLKQYSTETEENAQSAQVQTTSSVKSKPAEPPAEKSTEVQPVQFRFVRKVRRRSIFNEEDEEKEKEKELTKIQAEKTVNAEAVEKKDATLEAIKEIAAPTDVKQTNQMVEQQVAAKSDEFQQIVTSKPTVKVAENTKQATSVTDKTTQEQREAIKEITAHQDLKQANQTVQQSVAAKTVESKKIVSSKPTAKAAQNIKQATVEAKPEQSEVKTDFKKSEATKEITVSQDLRQAKQTAQKPVEAKLDESKKIVSSKPTTTVDAKQATAISIEANQKQSVVKNDVKQIEPSISKLVKKVNVLEEAEKLVFKRSRSTEKSENKSAATNAEVKTTEQSAKSVTNNEKVLLETKPAISHVAAQPHDKAATNQHKKVAATPLVVPKIEIVAAQKLTNCTAANEVQQQVGAVNNAAALEQQQQTAAVTSAPDTKQRSGAVEKVAAPTTNDISKRRVSLKTKDAGVRRASIAAVEGSQIEPPVQATLPLDIKSQRRPSDSEAIIKKKSVAKGAAAVDSVQMRKVKVISKVKRPSLKSSATAATGDIVGATKAIETKTSDKAATVIATSAAVTAANNSNKDAATIALIAAALPATQTLPTQLLINEASLTIPEVAATATTTPVGTAATAKCEATKDSRTATKLDGLAAAMVATLISPLRASEQNSQAHATDATKLGASTVAAKDITAHDGAQQVSTTSPLEQHAQLRQDRQAPEAVNSANQSNATVSNVAHSVANTTELHTSTATFGELEKLIIQESIPVVAVNKRASVAEAQPQVPPSSNNVDHANASVAAVNAISAKTEQPVISAAAKAAATAITAPVTHADTTKASGAPTDSNSVTATTARDTSAAAAVTDTTQTVEMPERQVGLAPVQAVQLNVESAGTPPFNVPKDDFIHKKKLVHKKIVRQVSRDKAAAKKRATHEATKDTAEASSVDAAPEAEAETENVELVEDVIEETEEIPAPPVKPPRKVKKKVIIKRQQRQLSISDTFFKEPKEEDPLPDIETLEKAISYVTDDDYDETDAAAENAEALKPLKTCMRLREYQIGDTVMYAERYKKTQIRWKKACVLERITSISYKLEVDGKEVPAHISYIKKFTDRKVNFGSKEYLEIDYVQVAEEEKKVRSYSIWNMV